MKYAALLLVFGVVAYLASAQVPNPTAPPSGSPTQVSAGSNENQSVETLRNDLKNLKEKVDKPPKDNWDKLTAVSGLLSGVLVALMAFYATNVYNRRQKKTEENRKDQELLIAQIQTVEKFFPHLSSSDEKIKGGALISIAALGNEDLAVRLAKLFSGSGATGALTTIASAASGPSVAQAESALLDALAYLKPRVVTLHQREKRRASGFIVSNNGLIVTTAHAVDGIPPEELRIGLPDGTFIPATIVKTDAQKDLALLGGKASTLLTPLDLSPASPKSGELVTALLIGLNAALSIQIGKVVGVDEDITIANLGLSMNKIAVKLTVKPGASGTPVVDKEGRLLGLVQGSDATHETTFLIPAADALAFVGPLKDVN